MLELARRIALGMDVRDFLELERAFERDRRTGAAAEVEHVTGFCQITRELLDLRLEAPARADPRRPGKNESSAFVGIERLRADRRDRSADFSR
jgi:hypothetical protein